MSDFAMCKTCGNFGWLSTHICPPVFQVREDLVGYDEADFCPVYASDPEEAAERYCEDHDANGDYDIVRTGSATLIVQRGEEAWRVHVEAESRPHYSGRVIEGVDE